MQLHGRPLTPPTTTPFPLPRLGADPLVLHLRPLSLGFHRRLRQHQVSPPTRPVKLARDAQGKPLRDPQGLALFTPDDADPDHLAAQELYHQRVAVLMLAESLHDDPHLHFETPAPTTPDWTSYADNLHAELTAAGFSAGDLVLACNEICRLSNMLEVPTRQAQSNFF